MTKTLYNIRNEINAICSEIKEVNNTDPLFSELFNINNKLWILEDLIREKSRKQEYDPQYILYSENIHKTNDERYEIKRKIKVNTILFSKKRSYIIQYNKINIKPHWKRGKIITPRVNMTNHLKYCQKYGINIRMSKNPNITTFS